ncbi:group 1 glycosyl transferase [Natronorubrum tibetense GA33]|uniref:Group 1 glycosyl transferase n=2 Tax=Natronorubrum tibetense TaxID=63128 RepID=L9VN54_9EURY|nr:glycosyltransferase family 4 protein [Natronorubrum tibetense]ELY37678.1 group 1 glycosyl transferase [Natronorubrum tibetense GA33]
MEIAFIHPSSPQSKGSGATHSATQIVEGLCTRGHDITVYCTDTEPVGTKFEYDIEQLDLSNGRFSNFPEQLNAAINQKRMEFGQYDLVHSYLMRSIPSMGKIGATTSASTMVTLNAYGGICPRNDLLFMNDTDCDRAGIGRCVTCTAHESLTRSKYEGKGVIETSVRAAYRFQDRIRNYRKVREGRRRVDHISHFHALSNHVKQKYRSFGFPEDQMSVIPNMVDQTFCMDHRSDFTEPYKLLYVGALRHRKGADQLVEFLEQYNTQFDPPVELTVVGAGVAKTHLKRAAASHGVENNIRIEGHVPYEKLPALYAEHDLFVYLGRWDEPFGRVFLEALCTGTPVFATNVGAVAEIVGEAGYVTDKTDIRELAEELRLVLNSQTLGQMSDRTTENLFPYEPNQVIDQFDCLYRTLV